MDDMQEIKELLREIRDLQKVPASSDTRNSRTTSLPGSRRAMRPPSAPRAEQRDFRTKRGIQFNQSRGEDQEVAGDSLGDDRSRHFHRRVFAVIGTILPIALHLITK